MPKEFVVPPTAPAKPTSSEPRKKIEVKTACTLIPSAETIGVSSTPARIIAP